MAKTAATYNTKVFIYRKDGVRCERVFDLRGRNKKARQRAEDLSVAEIMRMICEEGCEYLISYYKDRIN